VPTYLLMPKIWAMMWPIPTMACLVAALLVFAHRPRISRKSFFIVLLSFSLLGIVTGLLAGLSRTAAMGAVLPSVLSLVGALGIYLVGAEKADQGLVATCVIALSLDLLIGTAWGAVLRDDFERDAKSALTRKREALIEAEVRDFRRDLGLPDGPPTTASKKDSE
jgi:hypothetical protein